MTRKQRSFYEHNDYGCKPIVTFKFQVFNEQNKKIREKVLNVLVTKSFVEVEKAAKRVYRDFEKKVLAENSNYYTDLKKIQELYNSHIIPDVTI